MPAIHILIAGMARSYGNLGGVARLIDKRTFVLYDADVVLYVGDFTECRKGGRAMADKKLIASVEQIESRIFVIRGQKVMLDADLAELYGVETKVLNQAVKRNSERFPNDFMFQLNNGEKTEVVTNCDHLAKLKYSSSLPYAFTEHGALMLGNVLKSERAVEVSLMVVRAFVHLRELVSTHKELWIKQLAIRLGCKRPQPSRWLSQKLNQLERKVGAHDRAIAELINAIRQLMTPLDTKNKRPIGFAPWKEK